MRGVKSFMQRRGACSTTAIVMLMKRLNLRLERVVRDDVRRGHHLRRGRLSRI